MRNEIIEVKKVHNSFVEEINGGMVVRHSNNFAEAEAISVAVPAMPAVIEAIPVEINAVIQAEAPEVAAPATEVPGIAAADTANAATSSSVSFTSGNDVVIIGKNNSGATYNTLAGNDVIQIQGDNNTVKAGDGNDVIRITAGAGNGHVIYGDAGNDIITVAGGAGHTLIGGAGNDRYVINNLVAGGKYVIDQTTAAKGDRDSLSLTKLDSDALSMKLCGSDLILTHKNGATITIKGWSTNSLTNLKLKDETDNTAVINASAEKVTAPVISLNRANTSNAVAVMQSFMASLDVTEKKGFAAVDEAVAACSNGMYGSLSDLVDSFISDCLKHSGSSTAARKDFLKAYCGIDLDNSDTGAISGLDAGGKVAKTAESIVKENIGINGFVYDPSKFAKVSAVNLSGFVTGKSTNYSNKQDFYGVKLNDVTLYWDESNWSELGIATSAIRQVVGGVINAWTEAGLDLIEESYGLTLGGENSTLQRLDDGSVGLQLYFTNNSKSSAIASINSSRYYSGNITTRTYELMNINLNYYMNGCGNENGVASKAGAGYLDRTIAHELTHAVMAANINNHGNLPTFIKEGLSELTHGIDDQRTSSILTLVNTDYQNSTVGGLEEMLRKTFNLTSTSATNSTYTYAGGYMLMRYMAKQVSESGYDYSNSHNITEAYSQAQDAMVSFADNDLDFGSVLEINSYTRNDTMVFGNC